MCNIDNIQFPESLVAHIKATSIYLNLTKIREEYAFNIFFKRQNVPHCKYAHMTPMH